MWQQSDDDKATGNVADFNNKYCEDSLTGQQDSGIVDSGFLSSGGNLFISSELSGEFEESNTNFGKFSENDNSDNGRREKAVAAEQMKVDSGLDLGLSESLSQLTLKNPNVNHLGQTKVQAEPTVELKIIGGKNKTTCDPDIGGVGLQALLQKYEQEPWELYFSQDQDGDTQLHAAIIQGFLEASFSLIRMAPHPCLLNIMNDDYQSPLHLAVMTKQPRIVRRLLLAGANPTVRDFRGNTPLHLACIAGDFACATALTEPLTPIERMYLQDSKRVPALPQNLEQRNYSGEMCLHIAAAENCVDIVKLLLRLGADLEAREALSGRTALHLALERGCRSVIVFLLTKCQPRLEATTYGGITPYQIAVCFDDQVAQELVRLGAKPALPDSESDISDDSEDENNAPMPREVNMMLRQGVRAV